MTKTFNKILIANRGEIACRIIRTARKMGIATVAVFCDAEKHGKHVLEADEAYYLGPPPATSSYLLSEKIIEVAKSSGAQAIHPGYGFLSENAEFADAVKASQIEFIGPPSFAIRSMGSKSESKIIMAKANVPVLEGYNGECQDDSVLLAEAKKIGFPVLIKAIMGGGGKGMKLVNSEFDFINQLHSARREALNFFKDDRVIIERYVTNPRHIEVQIICDKFGTGYHLYERDCSVQRRHQKVLEECPAQLPRNIAEHMGDVAVRAAKAVGYVGAGTVEFIYDNDLDKYYFMEMNTRLQVEHPVTEEAVMISGHALDLVQLQVQVAMGLPLPFQQKDVAISGWAIEARIYAESPKDGFLPGSGLLHRVVEPTQTQGTEYRVRVDTGFRSGDEVLVYYDPMIAKLIVWSHTRERALSVMKNALQQYKIAGVATNIDFLLTAVQHPVFQAGKVSTNFIEEHRDTLLAPNPVPTIQLALSSLALLKKTFLPHPFSEFRMNHEFETSLDLIDSDKRTHTLKICVNSKDHTVIVSGTGFQHLLALQYPFDDGRFVVNIDRGQSMIVEYVLHDNNITVFTSDGHSTFSIVPLSLSKSNTSKNASELSGDLFSPINGKIVKLCVPPGSKVTKGQTVIILEAMKMEHNVRAHANGVVTFYCSELDMVKAEKILASLKIDGTE